MRIQIGHNIQKFRKISKMTQAQVAEYLDVSSQAVSKWEQELGCPDIYLIPKIAFLFDVSIDTLFGTTSLETVEMLIHKYSVLRNESNFKLAKEAVDNLLNLDPKHEKGLALLGHLYFQRSIEMIEISNQALDKLIDVDTTSDWAQRAKMQKMRNCKFLGDHDFLQEAKKAFDQEMTAKNINLYLIALAEHDKFEEMLHFALKHVDRFTEKEQVTVYENIMEACLVLNKLEICEDAYQSIIKHSENPHQLLNAKWLMWKMHNKMNTNKTEYYRLLAIEQLEESKTGDHNKEYLLSILNGDDKKLVPQV
jgi:transcriptional regulator with XRE-family HTH domain